MIVGIKSLASLILIGATLGIGISAVMPMTATFGPFAAAQTDTNNNGTQSANNNSATSNTNASNGMLDCEAIASQLGGQVIPNPTGVCDVTVPISGLEVIDNATGTRINQLLVINPIFEFAPIPDANIVNGSNATGNSSQVPSAVYGFAEIGTPEDRILSVIDMLSNTSWNAVAVHNHVIMESPKMMFVHATGMADIDTLTTDAKSILDNMANLQRQNSTATDSAAIGNKGTSPPDAAQGSDEPMTPPSATPNPLDS